MNQPDSKYFDYTATSPPYPEALARYAEISEQYFANPSSMHRFGSISREMLAEMKNRFCKLLNFTKGGLVLCSSGTEANNTIMEGHMKTFPKGRLLIASNTHDSIWYATEIHKNRTDIITINQNGQISSSDFQQALKPDTSLVCLAHACNETGAIQDLNEIASLCKKHKTRLLVDGVQVIGRIPVNLDSLSFDYYTFSSHKFGATRGTGGILFRDDQFMPMLRGGNQEGQLRAGTENLGGLASSIEALKIALAHLERNTIRLKNLTALLLSILQKRTSNIIVNSPPESLPGFVSLSFPGYSGSEMVAAVSLSGFAISTGSACHENQTEPSRVILDLGRNFEEANGTIRISMGRGTTEEAVRGLAEALMEFVDL